MVLEEGETQRLGKGNLQLVRKKGFETPLCVLRWFNPCDPQESEPPIHLIHPRVMKVARDESTIALTNVRKTQCNGQSDEQGPTSFTRQTCVEAAQLSIPFFLPSDVYDTVLSEASNSLLYITTGVYKEC